ncbi:hypothetical protein KIPB_004050, partial [Kipferlia bialata]
RLARPSERVGCNLRLSPLFSLSFQSAMTTVY